MAGRFYLPRSTAFDANGDPISGAKLEFFESGTTTPLDTFSDDALTVANTNPVIADSAGRFGDIFLQQADYKVTLSDADDNVIWTSDPVRADSPKSSDVREVLTTTVLDTSDDGKLVTADATSGAFIITLPAAATAGNGYEVTVQKVDSSTNIVTVDANGAETINGISDLDLPDQYAAAIFRCDGTEWFAYGITPTTATRILDPGFITGLELTNNSGDAEHDIDISAGSARSSDDSGNIILTTGITKRIDAAFAEGTNQGGLDTGTVAADTVYFVWGISKVDGTADGLFSLSDTSPTLPSGFTRQRLLGNVITDGSSNIETGTHIVADDRIGWHYFGSVATTSGSTLGLVDGLPDNISDIELHFDEVSSSSTGTIEIRLGTSSGLEATGYVSAGGNYSTGGQSVGTSTTGLLISNATSASGTYTGVVSIKRSEAASNIWTHSQSLANVGTSNIFSFGGTKSLASALTQISLVVSTGTFDAGTIYIRYR